MSDLAKWNVHGPVKTLRSEFAAWRPNLGDWEAHKHFTVVTFLPNRAISAQDHHNPDGTVAHFRWSYNDAGQLLELIAWTGDGPVARTLHIYDERGRPIRTTLINDDGTESDLEICSYDAAVYKTKVQFLYPLQNGSESIAAGAATTSYSVEGTGSAYSFPGATTMTVTYDENDFPAKVSFHDGNHQLLSYLILVHDGAGRLLSEQFHRNTESPYQNLLDTALPEARAQLAAMLKDAFGETYLTSHYSYDPQGRLVRRENRIGNLGGSNTTYRYQDHDDPIEEVTEHMNREGQADHAGDIHYSSAQVTLKHSQLDYLYDRHGNWTERIVSVRSGSQPDVQRSNIERRTITYHSA